jgi:hypothetical protein
MKGAVPILQAVLLVILLVSITSLSIPWSMKIVEESMDVSEVGSIKPQFDSCSEKILETARTGTTNKCYFNIGRGQLTGKTEGLSYRIVSTADICDQHSLTEIDERYHIWQSCSVSGENRAYEMLWKFPSLLKVNGTGVEGDTMQGVNQIGNITFDNPVQFSTLSLYAGFIYTPGESGTVVEISRVEISQTNVTLKIKFS